MIFKSHQMRSCWEANRRATFILFDFPVGGLPFWVPVLVEYQESLGVERSVSPYGIVRPTRIVESPLPVQKANLRDVFQPKRGRKFLPRNPAYKTGRCSEISRG